MPATLRTEYYAKNERNLAAVVKAYQDFGVSPEEYPDSRLQWLWDELQNRRNHGTHTIFNNGLTDDQNEELNTT